MWEKLSWLAQVGLIFSLRLHGLQANAAPFLWVHNPSCVIAGHALMPCFGYHPQHNQNKQIKTKQTHRSHLWCYTAWKQGCGNHCQGQWGCKKSVGAWGLVRTLKAGWAVVWMVKYLAECLGSKGCTLPGSWWKAEHQGPSCLMPLSSRRWCAPRWRDWS